MGYFQDFNSLFRELSTAQKQLEDLESFEDILSTYEKILDLIHQGMGHLSIKNQQCYILSLQPNGAVVKDSLGQVVLQPFVPNIQQ
ncbi:hypothetical protein BOKEGFJH_00121 [Chlamydia avium]|uniref:Uncharacterized protein n=2 Tax=Chlamydia avium TaxID=1457141 RepID=W8JFL5_9CHLA|nr:hypothetical protein [Chlamydia avium]AHK62995.1 Uncharacterized protein M832_01260 [Chlamydia avium 10DC88]EPP35941.1 hypothetical protein CP10743SC13_0447 [Chlamydia psittaci 10_743_SC13]EPP38393.1 hypothetical protein CP10881SC42_0532 [Chlamydia avium]VVT42611.1 hypothetical protein BOKEGFJH_00121 [Chlamydia avium]